MDNKDNTQVFSLEEIMQEFATGNPEQAEAPAEEAPELPAGVTAEDTVRIDDLSQLHALPAEEAAAPEEAAGEEEAADPEQEPAEAELPEEAPEADPAQPEPDVKEYPLTVEQIPPPKPILFRSRLGELKRKLVAGPEKRYYDLTEMGLGRVQLAILLSFLVVLLCAGGTAMYAMGMVGENRLRLMIFSQILAMMVSALLGCYVLMDGILDLFTGKFSLNSMLFLTLAACTADAVFCLRDLRVPCCAAFSLEMTFALWNRSLGRSTEMGQMDTLRKATRLTGLVKMPGFFGSRPGILRTEGRLEDFMDNYNRRTAPERTLNIFALAGFLASIGIAVLAGMRHDLSLAVQVFSTSMLVAVPAGAFVSQSRPAAILERRMHMVGTVICGWQGVRILCGEASFPLTDRDIFPVGSVKLNGVKFFETGEPDEVIACAAALMAENGGGLEPVFTQLLRSRNGAQYPVEEIVIHADGLSGRVADYEVVLGSAEFLREQGVEVSDSVQIPQAVYCAMDGALAAVFALNYSRTKASAGGLVTLGSYRKIRPLVLSANFMITPQLLKEKFGIRTKRYDFPSREDRDTLSRVEPEETLVAGALTTQQNLSSAAYAVTGARALRTASNIGAGVHIFAGVVGLLIMAALAYLGDLQLLSPANVLLFQAVWLLPGLLVTEWTRTV